MLAFSLPKKQNAFSFAQQSTIKPFYSNSNVSSNDTTVRESPAPATANTDRNKCKNQGEKHENKPFKIRTFSTKVNHKKSAEKQRIKMLRICAIEAPHPDTDFMKNINKNVPLNSVDLLEDEPSHYITHTRKDLANMKRKKNANKQTSLFNQIQIFKRVNKTSLMFRSLDFSAFDTLSHQPDIWLNQTKSSMEKQFLNSVIIVSFRLLNMQPKKYEKTHANYRRMTDVTQNSPYPIQTTNCLKKLSDSQMSSPFLNQSRIFYKTNSPDELNELRSHLLQNNLTNFAGIIDTHNKYAQTYNFYNLTGITNRQSCVIVIDEQETLRTQIPVFHGENVLFLTPSAKNLTYYGITEMIKMVKQIDFEAIKKEDSPFRTSKYCNQNPLDNTKENLHPNMANTVFAPFRHQNLTGTKHSSPTKSKGQLRKPKIISFPANAAMKFISLNMNDLQSRANQSEQYKVLKKVLRHKRNTSLSLIQGQNQSKNNPKNRSTQKVIQKDPIRPCKVELDGDFKQKMIKYVRILESERIQRILQANRIKTGQTVTKVQKKQNPMDDLQELTTCLTSRLKTKTPFQLVGDILKNNAHIACQIGKYLDQTKLIQNKFGLQEKRYTDPINQSKNTLQLMLYQI